MALIERLMGLGGEDPTQAKLPVHQFIAVMNEFARGVITGAEAQAAVDALSGAPLDAAGVAEAQALVATITGSATAKLARVVLINDVLLLAEDGRVDLYTTPARVRTRLGL